MSLRLIDAQYIGDLLRLFNVERSISVITIGEAVYKLKRTCKNVSTTKDECNHFKCSECGCIVMDAEGYLVCISNSDYEENLHWSYCPNCGAEVVS